MPDRTPAKERGRLDWRGVVGAATKTDVSSLQLTAAATCAVPVALCLAAGFALGSPLIGMTASTGAMSTGFGALHRLFRRPGLAMILAACGMGVCACLGAAAAPSTPAVMLCGAAVAMVCACLTRFGQPFWWFTLQWAIAYFLATSAPPDQSPLARGALVWAGGALQVVVVLLVWRWRPFGAAADPHPAPHSTEPQDSLRAAADVAPRAWTLRYTAAAGLMAAAGLGLERGLHIANGYWAPMTSLIILKPHRRDTLARMTQRIAGTLVGGGAATLLTALLRPQGATLAIAASLLASASYALQRVNYALFSFGVTATVVCLLALTGLPEPEIALRRIAATAIGAVFAVLAGFAVGDGEP